ncbi:hypothetical protein RclHR1_02170016 [Rhizophagus clarus]|uniref:Protein kinase domain-containing protein n=1 Tax=Rhizophagus clarus TaxID=94130 RepID=A0A2Z6QV19_9GLOM|nr:hypothetical protein RclHR1_11390005 [Rhizophagus clarus]GBB93435.1 hypothetical protein RclHR1_02170016 [Rhizophagus clarus]
MGFSHVYLTKEQELLIAKLISNEELKKRYKNNGLCKEFDRFIQKAQLKAKYFWKILEWIKYDQFENVEYLAKGGFRITYKTIWKDGYIVRWNSKNSRWERSKLLSNIYCENYPVVLKRLDNSQNIAAEFLKEIESHIIIDSRYVIR